MRKLFILLFTTLLTLGSVPTIAQNEGSAYTIQIGTFIGAQIDDFNAIQPYGFVYADRLGENLHQIYIGGFDRKEPAEELLTKVKTKGYLDAYIMERNLAKGQTVRMIQLASYKIIEPVNWARFQPAGKLYTEISGDQIRILTGIFTSPQEASNALQKIKNSGFRDAFVKNINSMLLNRISDFETKGIIVDSYDTQVFGTGPKTTVSPIAKTQVIVPPPAEELTARGKTGTEVPAAVEIPTSYSDVSFSTKAAVGASTATAASLPMAPLPTIRKNVKRTSALRLQEVMKAQKTYTGSLDGYYGAGTVKGYETLRNNNRQLQKYALLAKYMPNEKITLAVSPLQENINILAESPQVALRGLESSKHPLAKVYRAYILFIKGNYNTQVNSLMNLAIKETFEGKTVKNQPPFDFSATYAYTTLDQLILHLSYIQEASEEVLAVPCWLFQKHPLETAKAFEPAETMSTKEYKVQYCGGFTEWDPVQILQSIAVDLSAGSPLDEEILASMANEQNRMYLLPKPLNSDYRAAVDNWNDNLWTALDAWAKSDPLHNELCTALKIAYYQSQVLFEDYYMDKGLNYNEAKGLALRTLQTLAGPYLQSYL